MTAELAAQRELLVFNAKGTFKINTKNISVELGEQQERDVQLCEMYNLSLCMNATMLCTRPLQLPEDNFLLAAPLWSSAAAAPAEMEQQ